MYSKDYGRTPGRPALNDAMMVLDGEAAALEQEEVFLRIGHDDGRVVIDLGGGADSFVMIEPGGYEVTGRSPVTFRRTKLTARMAPPLMGGDPDGLAELLNTASEDLQLLWGWLVASCFEIPIPILFLTGEQGTGKTKAASVLSRLIDPSPAPVRAAPQSLDGWVVAADGSHVVALDNLSQIPEWLSDALCRASTGEALLRRALYTDSDLALLEFRRAIILTSIDVGAMRGDLGERLVSVELERILPSSRMTESELEQRFSELQPYLFGVLCELIARVLEVLPEIRLDEKPRMADFARVLAALDEVMGWNSLEHYLSSLDRVASDVLAGDPLGEAIRALVMSRSGRWEGTASDLLNDLESFKTDGVAFPKTGSKLSGVVKRLAPSLRSDGIDVRSYRTSRARMIVF
jgi:hypothetical protein